MEDHIHILCEVHPSISLSDFMREIKVSSSIWLKQNRNFPFFEGWAVGYGAFTYSNRDRDKIINYIKNQQEHHKARSYEQELLGLLEEQGVKPDMRYFP
jgi:REP element-mobilizing transposase RayT